MPIIPPSNPAIYAFGSVDMLTRPCVDCGQITGNYCDFCKAIDRDPNQEWAPGQCTPLCSICDKARNACHFCKHIPWVTPPPHQRRILDGMQTSQTVGIAEYNIGGLSRPNPDPRQAYPNAPDEFIQGAMELTEYLRTHRTQQEAPLLDDLFNNNVTNEQVRDANNQIQDAIEFNEYMRLYGTQEEKDLLDELYDDDYKSDDSW